jgi:hypothetical protein
MLYGLLNEPLQFSIHSFTIVACLPVNMYNYSPAIVLIDCEIVVAFRLAEIGNIILNL